MERIVRQVDLKGTVRLLELTDGVEESKRRELLMYIASLEESQRRLARNIERFWEDVTVEVVKRTNCYFCRGGGCDRCTPKCGSSCPECCGTREVIVRQGHGDTDRLPCPACDPHDISGHPHARESGTVYRILSPDGTITTRAFSLGDSP